MNVTFNIRTHHLAKKTGEFAVILRLTKNRKIKTITLPVLVNKRDHLNNKAKRGKWIRPSDPDYQKKNQRILKKLKKYEDAQDELIKEGIDPTLQLICNKAKNKSEKSILSYSETQLAIYRQKGQYNYSKLYNSVFNKLKKYLRKINYTDLFFNEIDISFLKRYEAYLTSIGNNKNTIAKNFKVIQATIHNAQRESIIDLNLDPFKFYKIKKSPVSNKALSAEDLKKIISLDLDEKTKLWNARNYFMFSYYCAGIRISDLMMLKWSNVIDDRLEYVMRKNGKTQNILLIPKAQTILKCYSSFKQGNDSFIFPILNPSDNLDDKNVLEKQISSKTTILNITLKKLALKAGINKNITTHTARHTFSDLARQNGASIYDVSKLLAHSDLKTTQNYLATLDQKSTDRVLSGL